MLDTDNFSAVVKRTGKVLARISEFRPDVYVSAIAVKESIQGAMAAIALAESGKSSLPTALRGLTQIVMTTAQFPILPFDEEADLLFQSWPKNVLRIGPNDCRIAASAIVHNAVVVTGNTKDYDKIRVHAGYFQTVDWRV